MLCTSCEKKQILHADYACVVYFQLEFRSAIKFILLLQELRICEFPTQNQVIKFIGVEG